ncbi:DsbA family oxidoreductase [Halobacillus sp. A5]|uniref:DsbA family oxidoreductase n=1 Tax=Halobacillus sp. A5 TaxID=2880263 RepID=UPI0020A69CE7|nr:DsbA family oxidoreductase [Halobacillus sp. A5]MCP3028048.1 DsbA family oxidoreductase [Halobacillus sp. A5]
MLIEVWSDFVCPFCYIGKRRLEQALLTLPPDSKVEVVYKSFELDPEAPVNTRISIEEKLSKKYGKSISEAKEMTSQMSQQASEAGLDFQFSRMVPTNTFKAHIVSKIAERYELKKDMQEILFRAVFTEGRDVGDENTLMETASHAGLDSRIVNEALSNESYMNQVRREEEEAQEIGVQGVPFFVINRKYAISGAQPPEVFTNSLKKALEEQ